MASPAIMAKKAAKQTAQILETVTNLVVAVGSMADELVKLKAEVAELKAAKPDVIELTAEIDETADRTSEILTAIDNAFGEIVGLKMQVAELTMLVDGSLSKPVQMPTRSKPKK